MEMMRASDDDITAAEDARRFELLADSTPVMIWTTDAEGRIKYVNRAYVQFFGKTEEEVRRNGWQPLVHPDDSSNYAHAFFTALNNRAAFHAQARVKRHDGQWRWIESWGAPKIASSGELLGYVGSSPDITERKRIEDALHEADRRKDQALAVVAHELRSPLPPILNAMHLLARVPAESPQAKQAREVIERQVAHMTRLIGDLMDVSGIRTGKIELHKGRCDLVEVARDTVENARPDLLRRGVTLELFTPAEPLWVCGDAVRLCQVAANLLNNAAKFTDRGGNVYVEVSADTKARAAVLRVRDTGVGIDRSALARIFEPFEQAGSELSRGRGGLGVGLALVKALVELHGGSVRADSEGPGKGSTFSVTLPQYAGAE
jgi:PAS domain S-box-containing protein